MRVVNCLYLIPHPHLIPSLNVTVLPHVLADSIEHVILCGIETHVCILQTAMDLVDRGKQGGCRALTLIT